MTRYILSVLVLAASLAAQDTGSLYGTVTDPAGASAPNARVTATSVERGTARTTVSDEKGQWVLTLLPLGKYNIKVEAAGFKTFEQPGIALDAEQNVKIDAVLQLGSTSETVVVTADAPLTDARSSTLAGAVSEREVTDMPLNGRNIFDLVSLMPGVSAINDPQTFTNDRKGPTFTTSGSRTGQNSMLFDGAPFNAVFRNSGLNYPPPDAIQEIRVVTSNYQAEYGRNSGTVMNVITRSGTNEIHGTLWEYNRDSAYNARTFFAKSVNKLVQNQYGASAGGPVIHNKLFIFGSYQGLKVRSTALTSSAKPLTTNESNGIFSSTIFDPTTGQPFPNNTIPSSRFDPVAVKVNQLIQPANSNGFLVANLFAPLNDDQGLLRADYYWGKHVIDARYNQVASRDNAEAGNVPGYEYEADAASYHTASIGDTYPISAKLLNVARVAYNRFAPSTSILTPYSLHSLGSALPEFGPPNPSEINVSSRFDIGNTSAAPAQLVNETRSFNDSLTWIHGAHTFKAGIEVNRLLYLNRTWFQSQGGFTFSGIFTQGVVNGKTTSAVSAADFLLGLAQTLSISTPALEQGGVQNNFFSFFQDDWRVSRRLTLNLGLRYELPQPWYQNNNYWGSFSPGQQSTVYPNAPRGLVFPGDHGFPRGLIPTDYHDFGPRAGFALDATGDNKTVVRGGFGVFYDAITANIIQNGTQPFRYSYTINAPYSLADPLHGLAPLPATLNLSNPVFTTSPPPQLTFPSPNMRTPYTLQYNLTVQRQILRDMIIEAAYVGKLGRKLLDDISFNPAIYAPGATVANENSRVLYPGFGNLSMMGTFANSAYNALQTRVRKQYSRNFSIQGTYTYSKSMDDFSGGTGASVTDTAATPNVFNLHNEWATSDFYAKHIASAAAIWDMPRLQHQHVLVREAAGGWQLALRYTARSGNPINVVTGADNALSGTPNQRPNVNGNPVLPSNRSTAAKLAEWFDPTVFSTPAPGTFGDLGRNALIGPGLTSTNVALLKNFPFTHREGVHLQFRAEAFSVFNTPIFKNPTNTLGSSLGKITSTGNGNGDRELQFALKLMF
jgi:Carboxypeptidase regulatory-like domain/TonB-dependent Receptor Plug Domain